jgi:hypothetical protein
MLERKGVQYLLQALDGLRLDFEVDVVGDGPYLPTPVEQPSSYIRAPS